MCLDFARCFGVVDTFAAVGADVVLDAGYAIRFAIELAFDFAPNHFDFFAAAVWAMLDGHWAISRLEGSL